MSAVSDVSDERDWRDDSDLKASLVASVGSGWERESACCDVTRGKTFRGRGFSDRA